ncbi:MAG: FCD domain-containing protein [Thermodesulfobacteriota bacterium]|nr:FCD domain-containing protein [Thermodesulfobacteriota bacterium]
MLRDKGLRGLHAEDRHPLGIVYILDNPFISETAEKIYDPVVRTQFLSISRRPDEDIRATLDEHLTIMEALKVRRGAGIRT